jgi:hypothetical protein
MQRVVHSQAAQTKRLLSLEGLGVQMRDECHAGQGREALAGQPPVHQSWQW